MLSEKARLNIAHTLSVRPLLCACKGRVRPHVHALLACPPCNPRTCMHPRPPAHVCNQPHGMCPFHVCAPSCSPRVRVRPPCVRVRTLACACTTLRSSSALADSERSSAWDLSSLLLLLLLQLLLLLLLCCCCCCCHPAGDLDTPGLLQRRERQKEEREKREMIETERREKIEKRSRGTVQVWSRCLRLTFPSSASLHPSLLELAIQRQRSQRPASETYALGKNRRDDLAVHTSLFVGDLGPAIYFAFYRWGGLSFGTSDKSSEL